MDIDDLDYEDLVTLAGMYSNYVQEACYLTQTKPVSIFEYLDNEWQEELEEMQKE